MVRLRTTGKQWKQWLETYFAGGGFNPRNALLFVMRLRELGRGGEGESEVRCFM